MADCAYVSACILILNPFHYLPNKVGEQNVFSRVIMGTAFCSSVNKLPFAVQSLCAGQTEIKSFIWCYLLNWWGFHEQTLFLQTISTCLSKGGDQSKNFWSKGDLKFSTLYLTGVVWCRSELVHEAEKQMCVCRVIKQLSYFSTVAWHFPELPLNSFWDPSEWESCINSQFIWIVFH